MNQDIELRPGRKYFKDTDIAGNLRLDGYFMVTRKGRDKVWGLFYKREFVRDTVGKVQMMWVLQDDCEKIMYPHLHILEPFENKSNSEVLCYYLPPKIQTSPEPK